MGRSLYHLNYQNSISWRCLEGLTTNMLIGYWYGHGKIVWTPLTWIYLLHWLASLQYHLFPSHTHFMLDHHMIDMVVMERFYMVVQSMWVYVLYLFILVSNSNQWHPLACGIKTLAVTWYVYWIGRTHLLHLLVSILSCCFYIMGDTCLKHHYFRTKVLMHVAFHGCISYVAYLETPAYPPTPPPMNFLRTGIHFLYLYKGLFLLEQ